MPVPRARKKDVAVGRFSPFFRLSIYADGENQMVKYFFRAISGWKKNAAGWKDYNIRG